MPQVNIYETYCRVKGEFTALRIAEFREADLLDSFLNTRNVRLAIDNALGDMAAYFINNSD